MAPPRRYTNHVATPNRRLTHEVLPDLLDLRAFCRVVDLGSVTRAALELGETKGSVSRRLSRVEAQLEVPLLRRSGRGVTPTEEGAWYRGQVAPALAVLDDANRDLRHRTKEPSGRLRLTMPQDLGTSLLAPIIARFSERFPQVHLEVLATDRVVDLDGERVDVALRAAPGLKDSALRAFRLMPLKFGLFASPDYLSQAPRLRRPADLGSHTVHRPFGVPGPSELVLVGAEGERNEVRVTTAPRVWSNEAGFIKALAVAAAGVALLPKVLVETELESRQLQAVLPRYRIKGEAALFFVTPMARASSSRTAALREFLKAELRRYQDR